MKNSFYVKYGIMGACFGSVFIIIGLLAFIFILESHIENMKKMIKTEGILTIEKNFHAAQKSKRRKVSVTFQTTSGNEITTALNTYNFTMRNGKKISLYYDPGNPRKLALGSTPVFGSLFLLVFGGIGSIIVISGIKNVKKGRRFNKQRDALIKSGYSVITDIIEINKNLKIAHGGKNPYIIKSRYSENGSDYFFESHDIWNKESFFDNERVFPAGPHLAKKIPAQGEVPRVRVYFEKNNYNIYYVDEDSLE